MISRPHKPKKPTSIELAGFCTEVWCMLSKRVVVNFMAKLAENKAIWHKVVKGFNKYYLALKGGSIMSQTKGVKLNDTTQQRLAALARIRDRSPHWLMCKAIEIFLEREENYEREKREDMERWERYQLTGEAIPHEKAAAWLENLGEGKVTPCPK